MSNNKAPNNEPKLVLSSSNHSTVMTKSEESDEVGFWTLATLGNRLANVPADLVPGYFSWNVTCIQGVSGSGKSLIAQELVTAYTTGTDFLGIANCTGKQARPNVGYLDQNDFSFDVLRDRLKQFGADESKVFIPTEKHYLDNEASYKRLTKFIVQHNIGLVILDSINEFYTFRDNHLYRLRKGFQALIDAGCAVVVLSNVVKYKRPDDIDAVQGVGLPEACDFMLSVYKTASGEMRLKPIKKRHAKGFHREEVIIQYDGESRVQAMPVRNLPLTHAQQAMNKEDRELSGSIINFEWEDLDLTGWSL